MSRFCAFPLSNVCTRAVTFPRSAANKIAPITTAREANIFSPTVSGPTHGVFISVVSDQYIDDKYWCSKRDELVSGSPGIRESHETP